MSRQDLFLITVVVDGQPVGVFDKKTGGETDSAETKYRPGGSPTEIALGGPQTVSNITVSRRFDPTRDTAVAKTLLPKVGKVRATVTQQPLDRNLVPFGAPFVYGGTLKKVTPPEADSTSSGAAMFEIEVSTDGTVG